MSTSPVVQEALARRMSEAQAEGRAFPLPTAREIARHASERSLVAAQVLKMVAGVVIGVLVVWFLMTALVQLPSKRCKRIRRYDPTGHLLPGWNSSRRSRSRRTSPSGIECGEPTTRIGRGARVRIDAVA